jgi:hypothetical protein
LYEKYYIGQSGNGVPVYSGSRGQRGHGLGSMLSGLFRSAVPLIRRGLAKFGRHALKTGLEIANDVADGQSVKDAAKRRVGEGIKRFASQSFNSTQSGSGKRRRTTRKATRKSTKKRRKKTKESAIEDIFN